MLSKTTALLVTAAVGAAAGAFLSVEQNADATDATAYATDATDTWNFLAIGDWGNDSPGKAAPRRCAPRRLLHEGFRGSFFSLMLTHAPY